MTDGPTLVVPSTGEANPYDGVPGIGDVIGGKYVVERVLGAGGMGVVVGARHLKLDEQVAIKCLLPSVANDKESVERFMREARASVKIKNEHVVRVMDVGLLDSGSPYILMEHLEGNDLGHHLRSNGQLPIADAVDYVLQACEAIAEAHALGIVHRDLKPSNLFLTQRSDGTPCIKVLDFGISKAMTTGESSQEPGLTDTRSVFGSPTYMSPEQVRSAKRVDHRTDIWALGVILHELITGTSPFVGESVPGLLAAIVADPPARVRTTRGDVPEGLELVIMRCLEKDVNRRTATVAELARALLPYAHGGSESSVQRIERLSIPRAPGSRPSLASVHPPTTPFEETDKAWETKSSTVTARKKRVLWAALGGAAGLLIASAIVARLYQRPAPPQQPVAATITPAEPTATATASATASAAATGEATATAPVASPKAPTQRPPAIRRQNAPVPSATIAPPPLTATAAPTASSPFDRERK